MSHLHYVMDLYFLDDTHREQPYHEVRRIVAEGDEAAVAEGLRINSWRKPRSFQIRSITSPTRSGDKVIYLSALQVPANDIPAVAASEPAGAKMPEIDKSPSPQSPPQA